MGSQILKTTLYLQKLIGIKSSIYRLNHLLSTFSRKWNNKEWFNLIVHSVILILQGESPLNQLTPSMTIYISLIRVLLIALILILHQNNLGLLLLVKIDIFKKNIYINIYNFVFFVFLIKKNLK